MTHPGLTSPRLADMRAVVDEIALSPREQRAVESALADIEKEWQDRKMDAYGQGVAERDRQHHEVIDAAEAFIDAVVERQEDVRNGRRTGREVRAWLRDARADFDKLIEQHRGVMASEARLAEQESQDVADYQHELFRRMPQLVPSSPTLLVRVREILSRPRQSATAPSQTQEDADRAQDDLVRALGGRVSNRRAAGW